MLRISSSLSRASLVVRARGGVLYVLADDDTRISAEEGLHVIRMPEHYGARSPLLHVVPLQLLAYCLMPNHWHLLLCPQAEGQLGRFMQRLTMTWHGTMVACANTLNCHSNTTISILPHRTPGLNLCTDSDRLDHGQRICLVESSMALKHCWLHCVAIDTIECIELRFPPPSPCNADVEAANV